MQISEFQTKTWTGTPEFNKEMGGLQLREIESFELEKMETYSESSIQGGVSGTSIHQAVQKFQERTEVPNHEHCYSIDILHLFD